MRHHIQVWSLKTVSLFDVLSYLSDNEDQSNQDRRHIQSLRHDQHSNHEHKGSYSNCHFLKV